MSKFTENIRLSLQHKSHSVSSSNPTLLVGAEGIRTPHLPQVPSVVLSELRLSRSLARRFMIPPASRAHTGQLRLSS